VVRNVRIGPSPHWLVRRLRTCGINSINNVVDVTNYVLFEVGQPLHAFDLDKLAGRRIVVRRARPGESIVTISQRQFELDEDVCVIADAERPVAIGGIMGGLETEVTDRTTNLLIESAQFDQVNIRRTSRRLGLASESSYRFERGVDPAGVDWASRRCCQLIAELAGGEVADGAVVVGEPPRQRQPIVLRISRLEQLLGIKVPVEAVRDILRRLGLEELRADATIVEVRPPSWRADLEREIDLIEEVGRIYGYEKVPEDVPVPAAAITRTRQQRVDQTVRAVLAAAGLHETITMSFVTAEQAELFRFWSERPPLTVQHPSRRNENRLRQSLIPSLLAVRRLNESRGVPEAELFEVAHVYLPRQNAAELPDEPLLVGIVAAPDLARLKGIVETLLARLHIEQPLAVEPLTLAGLAAGRAAKLLCAGRTLGFLGQLDPRLIEQLELRRPCAAAELNMDLLYELAQPAVQVRPVPHMPAVERELSLVVEESVPWARIESVVREHAGPLLETVTFFDIYRGKPIPPGKKSVHFGLTYRAAERTLRREEVDAAQEAIIAACRQQLGAELRST